MTTREFSLLVGCSSQTVLKYARFVKKEYIAGVGSARRYVWDEGERAGFDEWHSQHTVHFRGRRSLSSGNEMEDTFYRRLAKRLSRAKLSGNVELEASLRSQLEDLASKRSGS